MDVIGIVCEYNPFHNGHLYQIRRVKEMFPGSLIIVVLNGYFCQRGNLSLESKEEKTSLALQYGVDLVIELPFVFGSNSADIFAKASLELLNELKVNKLVFGSESDDIELLTKIAKTQLDDDFNIKVKENLKSGVNYPTALNKAIGIQLNSPNDLLGVSYIKTILENNYPIVPITIKRTNDYHDNELDEAVVSASNIRERFLNGNDISKYIPAGSLNNYNNNLLFQLLRYKIITDHNLSQYLTVDEGIENKLKKEINNCSSIDELVIRIKSKRFTYNRIMRMFIHILVGLTKKDKQLMEHNEYIRILGINDSGQKHLNSIKKDVNLPLVTKYTSVNSLIRYYELKAANLYYLLTDNNVLDFEYSNKPKKI